VGQSGAGGSHLAPFFATWLDTFIFNGQLDPQLREVAVLRIMWRCGQAFEWGNHYRLARQAGLDRDEILAVRSTSPDRDLPHERALMVRAADEIVDGGQVRESTFAAVRKVFPDPAHQQEFLYLLGGYRMFASVSATFGPRGEAPGKQLWPPDGVAPTAGAS